MSSSSPSPISLSGSTIPHRRRRSIQSANDQDSTAPSSEPGSEPLLQRGVDDGHQSPTPRPIFQLLGFGFILFLALLQFLPPTHFRHPFDPFRNWHPYHSNLSSPHSPSTQSRSSSVANSGYTSTRGGEDEVLQIISWMDCLDLRVLAVLVNSTLSNTRYPEQVSFHFFIPGGLDDKVSYYKLKVLFPHANLEILGQEKVKEQIMKAYSMGEQLGWSFYEIAPFVIPAVYPTLRKFVYVSPNVIFKEGTEKLLGVELKNFAVAIAEDCSKRLSSFINFDILDAIQRTSAKRWISTTAYSKDACMPDLSLVVIDATRWEVDLLEAILWWSRVFNRSDRDGLKSAVALALYNVHLKLDIDYRRLIHRYEDGRSIYAKSCGGAVRPDLLMLWKHYLPPLSDQILANN